MTSAIVVVGFNRPKSLSRLLNSLSLAEYSSDNIPLIVSIDHTDTESNAEVIEIAKSFEWEYGIKKVVQHTSNLGLEKHILECGDLTKEYGSIILLEDDLIVSPQFYNYAVQGIKFYDNKTDIAGLSLYAYEFEELGWYRFYPKQSGTNTYFMQWASSWGQAWSHEQWTGFMDWYKDFSDFEGINIPSQVKGWKNSWKKYFIAYLADQNKYFAFPYQSYTSMMDGLGTHHTADSRNNNVSLVGKSHGNYPLAFTNFPNDELYYDSFFQPRNKQYYIKEIGESVTIEFDLFGTKKAENMMADYVFSCKPSNNPIKSYSNKLIPYEYNLEMDIEGDVYCLSKRGEIKADFTKVSFGRFLYQARKVFAIKEMAYTIYFRTLNKFLNRG